MREAEGVPAAGLVTPADVIKTRLQVCVCERGGESACSWPCDSG